MNPSVACAMLVNGRAEMVKRAIASFHAQTYEQKHLVILDTTTGHATNYGTILGDAKATIWYRKAGELIGALRNELNKICAGEGHDIIAHWDSDDWSHPLRIEEQVLLLKASQKACVGYRQAVIWDERAKAEKTGKAYLYRNPDDKYCIGSSLCYWHSAWECRRFADVSDGEDYTWLRGVESLGVDGFISSEEPSERVMRFVLGLSSPRLICSIHGGNTVMREPGQGPWWSRAPQYDAYCKKVMQL